MKLTRLVVRLSALGIAAILTLPFVIHQVEAFGHTADDNAFPARTVERNRGAQSDVFVGAAPSRVSVVGAPSGARPGGNLNESPSRDRSPSNTATAAAPSRTAADVPTASGTSTPEPTVVFEGKVSRNNKNGSRWTSTVFTAAVSGEHELTLDWSGKGMLRFEIRDAKSDRWVGSDTSESRPKTITATLEKGRKYRLAVWSMKAGGRFTVSMTSSESPGDPADTPPPPEDPPPPADEPPPPPAPPTGNGYPGEPANGTLLWGAAVGGNSDPVSRHEEAAGHPLTVRRTYFQWSSRTSGMVSTARDDLANGRLPWVSVKTPSWTAMARGDHDDEIDAMLRALDGLNGPVWLTIHHEPEGGGGNNSPDDSGGPAMHVAMNRKVRERMTALGTDNIALGPILMAWTFNPSSGRNPNEWWESGIYDFLGVDHYSESESSLVTTNWYRVRSWAGDRGVDIAVGEWGTRGTDAAAGRRVQEWYDHAAGSYKDGKGARVVALAAFDSGLNSPNGSWELKGEQLTVFHDLLKDSRTADPR